MPIDEFVQYLQSVQKDLVGLVLPATITAAASLIALALTGVAKLVEMAKATNGVQLQQMQRVYPTLKRVILTLWADAHKIARSSSQCDGSVSKALVWYFESRIDEIEFRKKHSEADVLLGKVRQYVKDMRTLQEFLQEEPLPLPPSLHPIRSREIVSMTVALQQSCFLIDYLDSCPSEFELFKEELAARVPDAASLKRYNEILDSWFRSYR